MKKKTLWFIGAVLLAIFAAGCSHTDVSADRDELNMLFYYKTAENIQERFEFEKAWYTKINKLVKELDPERGDSKDAFTVSLPTDKESVELKLDVNYVGDADLVLLIESLNWREIYRLTEEIAPGDTWKDLDVEKGFFRFRSDILRQTRILEKEKFEALSGAYESTFNTYTCLILDKDVSNNDFCITRYNDPERKVRFDGILRVDGKPACLAQRGSFWYNTRWIYRLDSADPDKIYVYRYFHVYGKRLSEFIEDLKKIRFPKDYEFLLGVREEIYPETIQLAALVYSDDGKSLVPVLVYGEADAQSKDPTKVKFWSLSIGTPISIPKEFAQ